MRTWVKLGDNHKKAFKTSRFLEDFRAILGYDHIEVSLFFFLALNFWIRAKAFLAGGQRQPDTGAGSYPPRLWACGPD